MSDLFGIGIPEDWTREVLSAIEGNMNHDCFYLLTKQPQNLVKWSPFDKNCCVGVTVTSQEFLSDALRGLISIDAKVKYLSCEPLQGPLSVSFFDGEIQWAIIGAQTKPYKPPKIEWVVEIVEACDRVNIPVFLKNNLLPLLTKCGECAGACGEQIKIADILLDDDGNMRQEYPSGQG
jgi:protein gp37